jgi:transcriptional regulator with PAS, ATPase and Fis domain
MVSNNSKKIPEKYECCFCNYITVSKKDFNKHILSNKHIRLESASKMLEIANELPSNDNKTYACKCGKIYSHDSSYYRHKKKCNITMVTDSSTETVDKDQLIMMLIKQNAELIKETTEFKYMMMDVIKTGTHNTTNNTHTNSHNKTFNLNFFLNETCKNALNITDFVSSIKVSLDDLENTGRQGYVEGISNIILQKLKNLNHYDRPIHCADQKREVLYIKNDNQWIKESEEKPLLTKAIKTIANENIKQIKTWRDKNPECTDSESKKNNLYLKIVSNSMNGSTEEESDKNINKIISNVAKETIIPKE